MSSHGGMLNEFKKKKIYITIGILILLISFTYFYSGVGMGYEESLGETILLLLNTVYFHGEWTEEFTSFPSPKDSFQCDGSTYKQK